MESPLYRESASFARGGFYRAGSAPTPATPPRQFTPPPPPDPVPPPDPAQLRKARELAKARGLWTSIFGEEEKHPPRLNHEDFPVRDPAAPRTRVEWRSDGDDETGEPQPPPRNFARRLTSPPPTREETDWPDLPDLHG